MPRDRPYAHLPDVIREWCTCHWTPTIHRDEHGTPQGMDYTRNPVGCKLHDPHPRFDLPESI